MKKITKSLVVLTAAIVLLAFTGQASAFCVTNKSDTKMYVKQTTLNSTIWDSKRFEANLAPGESSCCNWQTKDCNKSGDPAAQVSFNVYYVTSNYYVCTSYEIPANGDLYITGTNNRYSYSR